MRFRLGEVACGMTSFCEGSVEYRLVTLRYCEAKCCYVIVRWGLCWVMVRRDEVLLGQGDGYVSQFAVSRWYGESEVV